MPTDTPTPDPSERPEVEPLSARDKYRGLDAWLEAQDRRISTLTAERDALSAEVASRERGRLGLVAARDDAVDQAVKAMARAAVLSAELERLRGIVEAASERHFIEYPSASDETWQTNARCACGASLLCTELVALAALAHECPRSSDQGVIKTPELTPAENIALSVAMSQVQRGDVVPENTTAALVAALARISRGVEL